jgi:phospholipase/lecithinase/hemolysin
VSGTTYGTIYAFGDSLSDAGNASFVTNVIGTPEPVSPPYYAENYGSVSETVFSNGPIWVQSLSLTLGLDTLAPSDLGGNDFAFGGAETGPTPQTPSIDPVSFFSLLNQVSTFHTDVPSPTANALYTITIGGNDVFDILANTSLTTSQQSIDIAAAVSNEIAAIGSLASDGAQHFLIADVPDLGKVPEVTTGLVDNGGPSTTLDALATNLSAEYNTDLRASLATLPSTLDLRVLDLYGIIDNAVANPGSYGLTNVTDPVWTGSYTSGGTVTLSASAEAGYLFWDHIHPTETGQLAIAAAAYADVTAPPACFAAGTRILTAFGEVPVEMLRPGDHICTLLGGGLSEIRWVGRREVDCARHPRPEQVRPVRIAACAFAPGVPHRDLLLSPDHAVWLAAERVLVPARTLVNGTTIAQLPTTRITYFHVELARHDVILAEGLPAESFLDTGNRGAFDNANTNAIAMHPDFAGQRREAHACAPLRPTSKGRQSRR